MGGFYARHQGRLRTRCNLKACRHAHKPIVSPGLPARKQRPHARARREKGLVIVQSISASLRHGWDLNKSVILWRGKELLFIRGRFESESGK
jgi:hypothetical protein